MTFLSLFAGIGGFDLGLERAGMKCIGQVEIDPFCRRVLAKHWPDVPRFEDVRTFTKEDLSETPDLICGGFPCQDISDAGKRAGIDGERSGLWSEFARITRELRPRFALVENVAALLGRGAGRVLGDLASIGYDAEWQCIPAAAVGAPHIRNRLFILAHARRGRLQSIRGSRRMDGAAREGEGEAQKRERVRNAAGGCGETVADASSGRTRTVPARQRAEGQGTGDVDGRGEGLSSDANRESLGRIAESRGQRGEWAAEPDLGRVAHGIPSRVDRLRGLGNAVVPQVAEFIGRQIMLAAGGGK